MRCLVTGVAGFIGSHVAERLLTDGHEVCGIDFFSDYYLREIKERNLEGPRMWNTFSFVENNLLDVNLFRLLEGVDWIFHQAAQAGVRTSWGYEFSRYVNYNVLTTQCLLEAALHLKCLRRFVYASSSSIYGDTPALPVTENETPHPVSPYGVTKLAAEHLCTLYHRQFGVLTTSLRYFTVYGPRQRPDMAFHRFCKAIIEHQPIRIFGDGQQTRDFTYIDDVVEANIRTAELNTAAGEVINIAGGSHVSIEHAIQLLQEISGLPVQVTYENKQPGDVGGTFGDTERAKRLIHYNPRFSLREGLAKEFAYLVSMYKEVRS